MSYTRGRGRGRGQVMGRLGPSRNRPLSAEEDISMGSMNNGMDRQSGIEVTVTGWHESKSDEEIIAFLKRKTEKPVPIKNYRVEGDKLIITVAHMGHAMPLTKLSGIRFSGDKLFIRTASANRSMTFNQSSPTISSIDALSHIIQSRFNPELNFLNLESLDSDTHWKMANLESLNASHSKIGPVLCKMIAEKCPNVQSISFANNRLKNLSSLSTLPERVPYLLNLSFQNNSLLSLRDIDMMKGSQFQQLRELILLGNPIHEHSTRRPGVEIKYRSDVKKIFPTIKVLDQIPLAEEVTFNVDVMESTMPPILSGFADSQMTVQTASDFVSKFFPLFDNNRSALGDLYDPNACFSLSINTVPIKGKRRDDFDNWWNWNRNLSKVTSADKRLSLIYTGTSSITKVIATLPKTAHQLQGDKFIMDAFQLTSDGKVKLFITAHGEFSDGIHRSFSRTFIIIPSAPGSRSALAGYPYSILNDQLCVRSYHQKPEWMPKKLSFQQQYGLNDQQAQQIQEFSKLTRLTLEYSLQCLNEMGWDHSRAMQAFLQAQSSLPRTAFQ